MKDQINSYVDKNYRIDTEYRHFIAAYDQIENTTPFEKVRELIQNIYTTEYLEKSVFAWNTSFEKNELQEVIPMQRYFYADEVKRIKEKVVVIISDAFRFEAARNWKQYLQRPELYCEDEDKDGYTSGCDDCRNG